MLQFDLSTGAHHAARAAICGMLLGVQQDSDGVDFSLPGEEGTTWKGKDAPQPPLVLYGDPISSARQKIHKKPYRNACAWCRIL